MFEKVSSQVNFPALEEETLAFWKERQVYEKSLAQRADCDKFVFYEGPPTANGKPHPGHCLTRVVKDIFPRYKTMRGFFCERKGGWDTHGLPVEVEVCKELGIHSKEEIERYGIEPFIHKCQQSVWRYMQEWERLTERLGFWIHLDEAYVTYHQSYVESVWWSLKQFFEKGLLYQGHKIVWWWAQGGTALSSGEVGQGYREVADPSVYVKFPLLDRSGTSLLVWTTTPWTLPSNQFAAVHPDNIEYATVVDGETGEKLILALDLVESIANKVKRELTVESTCSGSELIGLRYQPPFDYYHKTLGDTTGKLKDGGEQVVAWRVVPAPFVTTESGSGIVHQAPAFGEVDFDVLIDEQQRFESGQGPELICAVGPDGKFTTEAGDYAGRWVKGADKDICRELRARDVLYHQEQYLHDYPFCWRADDDPLIQYPRESWFIRTKQFKDQMIANNRLINWLPDHIQEGRFGKFLETNVDWALSRERYWGTPLPIWVCTETGEMEAIGSYEELLAKPGVQGTEVWQQAKAESPELPDDLCVHKPYIDEVTYDSPFHESGRMRRVSEVIDCWYDSGAMPFAQWGYPRAGSDRFMEQFPADFISEAVDQTRGWFYSQLAISTLLFGDGGGEQQHEFPHPFRNCIVLGLMLSEAGKCQKCDKYFVHETKKCDDCGGKVVRKVEKMSKRLRNYPEPSEIFDTLGADALRWFFVANQPPWSTIIYSERSIRESSAGFRLTLWNVYRFFVEYTTIDGFDPTESLRGEVGQLDAQALSAADTYRPISERGELDRWIISLMHRTAAEMVERMDQYDNFVACSKLDEFVELLSNWWVRLSRDRFWSDVNDPTAAIGKADAQWTLYECLLTISKLAAPFVPFLSDAIWRNLAGVFGDRAAHSVHLCDYPTGDRTLVDDLLLDRMAALREIASLGRSARMDAKLKVRQPLSKVEVILANDQHQDWLAQHRQLICKELNVKEVEFAKDSDEYISYVVVPNFKRLGPRVGKQVPAVKAALGAADGGELLQQLNQHGKIKLALQDGSVELDGEDIEVRLQAKPGWAAAQGANSVVVLATEITDELKRDGLARDLNRHVQERRKELDCNMQDRIAVAVVTDSEELRDAIVEHTQYLMDEALADEIGFESIEGCAAKSIELGDCQAELYVAVTQKASG